MDRRAVKLLAVVLSVGLLALCLGPVIGSCHTCHGDDCFVCRAIDFVTSLIKTAGPLPPLLAGAVLTLAVVLRKQKSGVPVLTFNPVELHTKILS